MQQIRHTVVTCGSFTTYVSSGRVWHVNSAGNQLWYLNPALRRSAMTLPSFNYRLVTRSDFDGLVSAALLRELGMIDDIMFVHPKDMQDGLIEIDTVVPAFGRLRGFHDDQTGTQRG